MTFEFLPSPDQVISGLYGSSAAWYIGAKNNKQVILAPQYRAMETWAQDLETYFPNKRVFAFPPLPGTPYVPIPLHEEAVQQRHQTLQAILQNEWDILVTLPQALFEVFPAQLKLDSQDLFLERGVSVGMDELCAQLIRMGYSRVDMVSTPGEFARRGAIVDLFAPLQDKPVRIEYFDVEIEDLRSFDPESQRSLNDLENFKISPHFLWQVSQENIQFFSKRGAELWNRTPARNHFLKLVQMLQENGSFPGYQHWTRLLFEETVSFLDLIGEPFQIVIDCPESLNHFLFEYSGQLKEQTQEARSGNHVWAEPHLLTNLPHFPNLEFPSNCKITWLNEGVKSPDLIGTQQVSLGFLPIPRKLIEGFQQHQSLYHFEGKRVFIFFSSLILKKRFQDYYSNLQSIHSGKADSVQLVPTQTFELSNETVPGFYLKPGHLSTGFEWPEKDLIVLSDRDIWPHHPVPKRISKKGQLFDESRLDLTPGDLVIHEDHGIGRFEGLQEIEAGGQVFEMISLTYRHEAKLHLALSQLSKIERFSTEGEGQPALDVLGGTRWAQAKLKARASVEDMTHQLLDLYASRKLTKNQPLGPEDVLQLEFEDAFEFEPTPDQQKASLDIHDDLRKGEPMDRLLIGDVGFGKTEVAMRMMFRLVIEGYQVALLCPTTFLAYQHYLTISDRFEGFPVSVGFLSRLLNPGEIRSQLTDVREGRCDVVIGTHRLLSQDLVFKNLGGLVVDEEQRFGVRHKERIKELKKDIHVLSMSATPIPRTLNMALHGLRDISVIRTPPKNRLAITTTVIQYDEHFLKRAIEFELSRGGQVYVIYNEIETMPDFTHTLQKLVPTARMDMAHGKMASKTLETVTLKFIKNEVDVLVATTLVENGMDVPNANTMLIIHAQNFGLSQLYQLRGRIGRSDRPAYAYLVIPRRRFLSSKAKKRLDALEAFSSLGSGFRLAALDLEIRGAGNMLGASQSGHIQAVGYSLFTKMLREATEKLKGGESEARIVPVLNLRLSSAVPRNFVEDPSLRLSLYRNITQCLSLDELREEKEKTRDCYGPIPPRLELLFEESRFRIEMIPFGIASMDREGSSVKVQFHSQSTYDFSGLMHRISKQADCQFSPEGILTLKVRADRLDLNWLLRFRQFLFSFLDPGKLDSL